MKNFFVWLHTHRDDVLLIVVFISALIAVQLNDDHALAQNPQIARSRS